jgi:hypothetical protein
MTTNTAQSIEPKLEPLEHVQRGGAGRRKMIDDILAEVATRVRINAAYRTADGKPIPVPIVLTRCPCPIWSCLASSCMSYRFMHLYPSLHTRSIPHRPCQLL